MGDIIEKNDSPEPKEASQMAALGGQAAGAASVEVPSYMPRRTVGQLLRSDLGFIPVLLTLVIVVIYFTVVSNGIFLKPENLSNLVGQIATIGILGLGSIMVLLLGEIDLSVASVSVLCSVIMAVFSERLGVPGGIAILVALLVGAIIGLINGLLVAVLRVPAFIVTLAGSIGYAGLLLNLLAGNSTLTISNGLILAIAGTPRSFLPDYLGVGLPILAILLYAVGLIFNYTRRKSSGLRSVSLSRIVLQIVIVAVLVLGAVVVFESYQGVPYSTAILFGLITLFWLILTKTAFGRHVYAVGGNSEAARRAGINVVGIRIAAFTLCSTLAAVSGGVSLFGGRGSVWAIVLGVLIIGSLVNGLALLSQGTDVSEMVEGAVLVIAVTVDALVRRAQARTGR